MNKIKEVNEYGQNISVKNANLWYGDFQALKDISVEIPERQVTAFIGPSGCGKSTFLKCFNRMNDLVEGCKIEGDFRIGSANIYGKIDKNEIDDFIYIQQELERISVTVEALQLWAEKMLADGVIDKDEYEKRKNLR